MRIFGRAPGTAVRKQNIRTAKAHRTARRVEKAVRDDDIAVAIPRDAIVSRAEITVHHANVVAEMEIRPVVPASHLHARKRHVRRIVDEMGVIATIANFIAA